MNRELALAERAAVAEHSCVLAAFDNAAQGMAIVDERGRVVAANRRMASLARAHKASLVLGAEFAGIFDLPSDPIARGGECQLGDCWFQVTRSETGEGFYLLVFNDIT